MRRADQTSVEDHFLVTVINGIHVIQPERSIDARNQWALDETFGTVLASEGPVVLDLGEGCQVGAGSIVLMGLWARRLAASQRTLAVSSSQDYVKGLLIEFGLSSTISLFSDLWSAIRSYVPRAKRPLGDILRRDFSLPREALMRALRRQSREGGLLGRILLTQRAIEPVILAQALNVQAARG